MATWKPVAAAAMMFITAVFGLYFSGAFMAAPLSPWVTGPSGEIQGTVKADNVALANVTVAAGTHTCTTNETGWFDLKGLETGRQVIIVDAAGYKQLRYSTMIGGGSPLRYSFVLKVGNGTDSQDDFGNQVNSFYTCGALTLIFTAFAIIGGIFSFWRKRFSLATTGALMGMGILPAFPYTTILCVIALMLLLFSRS
jgi:hypothetical protein